MNHFEKHESALATFWLDEEGIFRFVSKNTPRTMENVKENMAMMKQICPDQKVCVIADMTQSYVTTKEIRNFLIPQFSDCFKAIAFISKGALGKITSSLFLIDQQSGIAIKPSILPMHTCSDEKEAKEWLKQYL